jgi:hypothetical protein
VTERKIPPFTNEIVLPASGLTWVFASFQYNGRHRLRFFDIFDGRQKASDSFLRFFGKRDDGQSAIVTTWQFSANLTVNNEKICNFAKYIFNINA